MINEGDYILDFVVMNGERVSFVAEVVMIDEDCVRVKSSRLPSTNRPVTYSINYGVAVRAKIDKKTAAFYLLSQPTS